MKLLKGFYIFVLIFSLIHIINNLYNLNNVSLFISIIGLLSCIAFFLKYYNFYFLGIIWIIAQIPILKFEDFTFNMFQFLDFHFALNFGSFSFGLSMYIFLIPFIKPIILSKYLLKNITFNAYTQNSKLKIEDQYSFIPTDLDFKKLISHEDILIDNEIYSLIEFQPMKSERFNKAGITLKSLGVNDKISTIIKFEIDNNK